MTETVWHEFRKVGLEFAETAPVRYVVKEIVAAPRQAVWNAFADPASWRHWFPHVEWVRYEGKTPYGVGTIRKSSVAGCLHDQTMVVWDEPKRWGYIIDRATQALGTAQIELTEFEEVPSGTRVRWVLAVDPLEGFNFLAGGESLNSFLKRLFADAMCGLERYVSKPA